MRKRRSSRWISCLLALVMLIQLTTAVRVKADAVPSQLKIVLTLGADLSAEQKAYILQYFGISEAQVQVITITNADERAQLGNLISEKEIGTKTLSCALVRPMSEGGIQVKTANMNYVTSNMIASTLSTSGVYNCEVLTAAPFEVSGTGALTGVMMAYETASGETLDAEKKELANEELVITGEIADTVGQDQATLVVNDIKIHIVRDQITDQQDVNAVVDEVIATTEQAAQKAAESKGMAAPAKLGQVEHEKLYNFGYKFSQMGYRYKDMQQTLERVTHNVTKSSGIDDPITDTFTTINDDTALSVDSILMNTDDTVLGEDAIVNATNNVALGDHPAEPIEVFTREVTLTESGGVKAEYFISDSNVIAYKDVNGSYALMDLNGNILTDSVFTDNFRGKYGYIAAQLDDGSYTMGLLGSDGTTVIPFQYGVASVLGEKWGAGIVLTSGTQDDYDYTDYSEYYQIDYVDLYYLGSEGGILVSTLTREQAGEVQTSGDYVNIMDRNGVITTYDSTFTPLQTAEYLSEFGDYDEDRVLRDLLSEATGYSVYGFNGNYAKVKDYNIDKCGVIDRYGNIIVPLEFDSVDDWNEWMVAGGYFAVEKDGKFAYVVAGGEVTGSFNYSFDDVRNYGMSAKYEGEDGSVILLSGDGKETNLGTSYEHFTAIEESRGMFWKGLKDGKYDLIDWHGNVLVSGSEDYSLSDNGNYLIAQNGYTSSTLYLVNDAAPVSISESAGGASELEVSVKEGASLEAYTGDPVVELAGDNLGRRFIDGTDLLIASNDGEKFALMDVSGKQLTNPVYTSYFEYSSGWLIAEKPEGDSSKYGLLSLDGTEIIPCSFDVLDVLNENWAVAYTLTDNGTEEDYDFRDSEDGYYYIETAVIYHISPEELTSVTLTRDQIQDVQAEEQYINVEDRSTGKITTYDSGFSAIASVDSVYDFDQFSGTNVLIQKIQDSTGWYISNAKFIDGYNKVVDYSQDPVKYGIIDMNGNLIIPLEYDDILANYTGSETKIWANGYFGVAKDGLAGYVTQGGTVTCELKYPIDNFINYGMAASLENEDGSYTLVAADGTEIPGFSYLRGYGNGLFWEVEDTDGNDLLIDWHGNVLFEDFYDVDISEDGKYILLQQSYDETPKLYAVDGAEIEASNTAVPETEKEESEEQSQTEEVLMTEASAMEEMQTEQPMETEAKESEIPAETEAQMEEKQTEAAGTQSVADQFLKSAAALVTADWDTNKDSILLLLGQAKTVLDEENPDAAMIVNSAITLLESGTGDANSISTLITTAQEML